MHKILGYPRRTLLSVSDFGNLGWLNVENRVKQLMLHVYDIFNNKCPTYLQDNFIRADDIKPSGTGIDCHRK